MSESIEFSSFVDWLEHQGEIDGPVVVSVTRSRFSGNHQDFAHGLVEARLDSPFGRLSIIRSSAAGRLSCSLDVRTVGMSSIGPMQRAQELPPNIRLS